MTDRQTDRYLASFRPLADKGFVHGCEGGSVVINVQQMDEDRNMAALPRIICKVKRDRHRHQPHGEPRPASW